MWATDSGETRGIVLRATNRIDDAGSPIYGIVGYQVPDRMPDVSAQIVGNLAFGISSDAGIQRPEVLQPRLLVKEQMRLARVLRQMELASLSLTWRGWLWRRWPI